MNSFQATVHQYNIGIDLIEAFLLSMRADLYKDSYDTVSEYEEYIYGSADVVGLMCLKVFVNGDELEYERLKEPAMKLGSAFQKVNFLRDLKDDSEILSRTYFPTLVGNSLEAGIKDSIVAEINNDFEEAYLGIKQLPLVARFGVFAAYVYYRKLLTKLVNTNAEDIMSRRIRISNPMKMGLLARAFVQFKLNLL